MNHIQTLFTVFFCSALSFGSFSQTDTKNTDCSSSRWISVKNSEVNAALFASFPEIFVELERQSDLKLLFATRELQEIGPLTDDNGKPFVQTMDDGTQTFIYQDKTITTVQSDIPLVNDYGDPIIVTSDDGLQSYVFPPPVITSLNSDANNVNFTIQPQAHAIDQNGKLLGMPEGNPVNYSISELAISELRIVEAKYYDAETGIYSNDFHVSRIGFCMNPDHTQQERLWVDLISFFENMENPEESPFYTLLTERGYKGFQYKQNPCK